MQSAKTPVGQDTLRTWVPWPQLESHGDQALTCHAQPRVSWQTANACGRKWVEQSASVVPPQETLLVISPSPQLLEHSDQRPACQEQPVVLRHEIVLFGRGSPQSTVDCEGQNTALDWNPDPQDVALQPPHSDVIQLHLLISWHASAAAGRGTTQSLPVPEEQVTRRMRDPTPQ